MINVRTDLLQEYLCDRIDRANYLHEKLHINNEPIWSKDSAIEYVNLIDEYTQIVSMLSYLNVFNWMDQELLSTNDIKIV